MSLSIAVFLLHTLGEGGPMEMLASKEHEKKPLEPFRSVVHDGENKKYEEDIRWLMK